MTTPLGDPFIGALLAVERAYERYREHPSDTASLEMLQLSLDALYRAAQNVYLGD